MIYFIPSSYVMQGKPLFWVRGGSGPRSIQTSFQPRALGHQDVLVLSDQGRFLVCTNPVQWNPAASHHRPIGGRKREVVDWFFIYLSFRPKTNFCFGAWGFFLRPPPQTLVNSRKQNSPLYVTPTGTPAFYFLLCPLSAAQNTLW